MEIRLENPSSEWQWPNKVPRELVGASVLRLHHILCSLRAKRSKVKSLRICVVRASHVQSPLAEV